MSGLGYWVFWLALLLPLSQAVAQWHLLSHHTAGHTGQTQDDVAPLHPALSLDHCDLCASAASVLGGAEPPAVFNLPVAAAQTPFALAGSQGLLALIFERAYNSRAPPIQY